MIARRELLAVGASTLMVARARADVGPVDVALVMAVDVSRSINEDEARLQREGYRAAISDPRVVEAICGGMIGSISLCYVEWAGIEYQRIVIPWFCIASQRDADVWAERLAQAPRASLSWTSISGGIEISRRAIAECPYEATRKVIDVSGDGVNNSGPPAEHARDRAIAEGITINGLPILDTVVPFGASRPPPLDQYYRDSVIGGQGAFVMVAESFDAFGGAVRRKLIREIAGLDGPVITRV